MGEDNERREQPDPDRVPPYDDRTGTEDSSSSKGRRERVQEQLSDTKPAQPGKTASPADEQPARAEDVTDEPPESPKGVGDSPNRSGEDIAETEGSEPGRHRTGTKGESQRPKGESDERDATSIDPKGS